jgi:hypothetical protein
VRYIQRFVTGFLLSEIGPVETHRGLEAIHSQYTVKMLIAGYDKFVDEVKTVAKRGRAAPGSVE